MKKFERALKGIILAATSLTIAFLAIAVPFRLIGNIEGAQLRAIFLAEILLYFVLSMLYLVIKERNQSKKLEEKEKRLARREKFEKAQREYYDLAA